MLPSSLFPKFWKGFTIDDAYKDIVSCVEITSLKGLPVPILDAMNSIYKTSMLKGYGDKYKGALVCVYTKSTLGNLTAMMVGASAVVIVRFLAMHYRWNLPRIE